MYRKKDILEALTTTGGNVTRAAELVGCDRRTITLRLKKDADLAARLAELRRGRWDRRGEVAESKIDEALDAGKPWAVTFVLKYYWGAEATSAGAKSAEELAREIQQFSKELEEGCFEPAGRVESPAAGG